MARKSASNDPHDRRLSRFALYAAIVGPVIAVVGILVTLLAILVDIKQGETPSQIVVPLIVGTAGQAVQTGAAELTRQKAAARGKSGSEERQANSKRSAAQEWHKKGRSLWNGSEYDPADRAVQHFSKAIKLDPSYASAYHDRGNAYYGLQKFQQAIQDYDKVIELDPNDAFAYNNRGNAYHERKEYGRAIRDLDKAIELDPKYGLAYFNRGATLWNSSQKEKACREFRKSCKFGIKQGCRTLQDKC